MFLILDWNGPKILLQMPFLFQILVLQINFIILNSISEIFERKSFINRDFLTKSVKLTEIFNQFIMRLKYSIRGQKMPFQNFYFIKLIKITILKNVTKFGFLNKNNYPLKSHKRRY